VAASCRLCSCVSTDADRRSISASILPRRQVATRRSLLILSGGVLGFSCAVLAEGFRTPSACRSRPHRVPPVVTEYVHTAVPIKGWKWTAYRSSQRHMHRMPAGNPQRRPRAKPAASLYWILPAAQRACLQTRRQSRESAKFLVKLSVCNPRDRTKERT